jgi:hypothetical protein
VSESVNRDQSRDRRREEALARRVGEALDQLAHRDSKDCPDAELIAAYQEKSLQPEEIARWEGHFATCARCRKILLVLGASAGTPLDAKEVARLGQLVAVARAPLEASPKTGELPKPSRFNWRSRWLAPALGVAAVLAVWFAIRPPWRQAQPSTSEFIIAQGPKSESLPRMETQTRQGSADVDQGKAVEAEREVLKDKAARIAPSTNLPTDSLAKKLLDARGAMGGNAPSATVDENALRDEKKEKADSNSAPVAGTVAGAFDAPAAAPRRMYAPLPAAPPPAPAARPPAPLPQAQAKTQDTQQAPADKETPGSTSQSVTVTEAIPLIETTNSTLGSSLQNGSVADLPLNGRDYQSLLKLQAAGVLPVELTTPSGKVVWRAGNGGNILRSTDGNATWILQTSPLHEDWVAGAAISDTVCWMVGRNGSIARTTDGKRWKKIAPPSMAADSSGKFPDWTGVAATDAKNAAITASDGRRFATENAGKTWKAQ